MRYNFEISDFQCWFRKILKLLLFYLFFLFNVKLFHFTFTLNRRHDLDVIIET